MLLYQHCFALWHVLTPYSMVDCGCKTSDFCSQHEENMCLVLHTLKLLALIGPAWVSHWTKHRTLQGSRTYHDVISTHPELSIVPGWCHLKSLRVWVWFAFPSPWSVAVRRGYITRPIRCLFKVEHPWAIDFPHIIPCVNLLYSYEKDHTWCFKHLPILFGQRRYEILSQCQKILTRFPSLILKMPFRPPRSHNSCLRLDMHLSKSASSTWRIILFRVKCNKIYYEHRVTFSACLLTRRRKWTWRIPSRSEDILA